MKLSYDAPVPHPPTDSRFLSVFTVMWWIFELLMNLMNLTKQKNTIHIKN